ncbi:MAG TPA: helix-turn-helix domain-containing protein [Ktedonobacteraceae bacterium]|nr:helix-turn-helix domain-containing protein [Ktedonobacteraceae bacterium]
MAAQLPIASRSWPPAPGSRRGRRSSAPTGPWRSAITRPLVAHCASLDPDSTSHPHWRTNSARPQRLSDRRRWRGLCQHLSERHLRAHWEYRRPALALDDARRSVCATTHLNEIASSISALQATDGKLLWSQPGDISLSLAQVADDIVYEASGGGIAASRGSIHRLAKKEGIELQPTLLKLTDEKQEEALALLKQGVSLRQVAKRLGVNHETLRKFVKRFENEQE